MSCGGAVLIAVSAVTCHSFSGAGSGIAVAGRTGWGFLALRCERIAYAACPVGHSHSRCSSPDDICPVCSEDTLARVIVEVMLKPEIHDPQGEAILGACHRLGFTGVTQVRQGKRFELELDGLADEAALTAVRTLAAELLANPVIEEPVVIAAD